MALMLPTKPSSHLPQPSIVGIQLEQLKAVNLFLEIPNRFKFESVTRHDSIRITDTAREKKIVKKQKKRVLFPVVRNPEILPYFGVKFVKILVDEDDEDTERREGPLLPNFPPIFLRVPLSKLNHPRHRSSRCSWKTSLGCKDTST